MIDKQSEKPAISEERIEAFLTDYQKVASDHNLDFAINYDLTEDGAVKAKFVIVPKPNDENNTEDEEVTVEVEKADDATE